MLNVAVKAARARYPSTAPRSTSNRSVSHKKKANDFVTEVDHAAEQAIIETLLGAYPKHGIWLKSLAIRMATPSQTLPDHRPGWTAPPTFIPRPAGVL